MSAFRDIIAEDRENVFLNPDEFAEEHLIEGSRINVSWQDDEAMEDPDLSMLGTHTVRIYARAEDLPARKVPGDTLWADHVAYTVEQWSEAEGVAVILMSRPESG